MRSESTTFLLTCAIAASLLVFGLLTNTYSVLAASALLILLYAIRSHRRLLALSSQVAEHRRLVSAGARSIFWRARVTGNDNWRTPPDALPGFPFQWELRLVDPEAAAPLLGPPTDPLHYLPLLTSRIDAEDQNEFQRRFHQAVLRGDDHLTQRFRIRDAGGRDRCYLGDISITPTGRSQWECTGACVDITDLKGAEDAVRESEQHLRQLMLEAKSLLFDLEATALPEYLANPDPRLVTWRSEPIDPEIAQNLLPMEPPPDGVYRFYHFSTCRHPDDARRLDRSLADAVYRRASSYSQEYRCKNRFGSYQWFSETVYLTYLSDCHWRLTGVVQDITARKRAEESIQDVMRQADCIVFHGTLRTGDDPSDVTHHAWDMTVADLDSAQRVLPLALAPAQSYCDAWAQSRDPKNISFGTQNYAEALRENILHFSQLFRVRDAAGDWHWMSEDVRMEPVAAHTYRVVAVCVDITAQKRIQEALERARAAAEEANNAKTAFLANMSHEIRTPMTAVVGYSDLLIESSSASERESYARTIQRNCEHLMTVLDDILDLSRIESGRMSIQMVPCSPIQIAEEVADMLRPKALEKAIELSVEILDGVPRQILTDPVRLRQILVNLAGNAVKFTDHGSVLIRLDSRRVDSAEPMLIAEVSDTGIGIPPDQIPLLFRPFQQGDLSNRRRFGGTGLGLAISRRLAQLLGGDVSVVSQPGRGSVFTVKVSGKPVQQPAPRPPSAVNRPMRLDGIRVLLAEDGADTRRLVCIHLRRLGCDCVSVENGQEAVDLAVESQSSDTPFDVILMDMQMPVLDGYSACKVLRDRGYTRAIIALTAHAMEGDRLRCIEAGCDDYIVKPINISQLCAVIARHAGKQPEAAHA